MADVSLTLGSNNYPLTVVNGTELQLSLSGPTGPTGPTGAAGPNTVSTSTTTSLNGYLYGNGTTVGGATSATSSATANTLALRDGSGGANFAAVGATTVTASVSIATTGDDATIGTSGSDASIYTTGYNAHISTTGANATIGTTGANATISTNGVGAYVSTFGDDAFISTSGINASISTSGANADIFTIGDDATISTEGANASIITTGTDAYIATTGINSAIFTQGDNASISTSGLHAAIGTYGRDAFITTSGLNAAISTSGNFGHIRTDGANAYISTSGQYAPITTSGADAYIRTSGTNAYIQSRSTFKLFNGTYTTTLSHSPTDNRAIAFPNDGGTVALINPSSGTQTFTGSQIFSSTTRPTSSGTGTPAATSLITFNDLDNRIHDPTVLYLRDDFVMGSQSTSGTIGELGWDQYGVGTGKTITSGTALSPTSNPGQRILTSGNVDTNGQTIYWPCEKIYPAARTAWQMMWVFRVNQTTLCDVIAGMTADSGAIGIGKFGGISVGVRYSSATDTNFMFYSKNTNTTFAANDANNYSITSGIAADTSFHTVRMRSTTLAAIEMSIDGGAWVAVTYTPASSAAMIPFFYIATRTAATKQATIDYFSYYGKSLPR